MDKLSSLNLSFDRVLIQLFIPGLIAVFPWFLLYIECHPNARNYLYNNSTITVTVVSLLALIGGLVLENLGARLEVIWFDKQNEKTDAEYKETWNKFLKLDYDGKEPIGHRYIRNILLRMKFELSAGIALIPMSIGLAILDCKFTIFSSTYIAAMVIYLLPAILCFYFVAIEAKSSSRVLGQTRKLLVDKYS